MIAKRWRHDRGSKGKGLEELGLFTSNWKWRRREGRNSREVRDQVGKLDVLDYSVCKEKQLGWEHNGLATENQISEQIDRKLQQTNV